MKKINVKVIKATQKAVLVEDAEGRQAWVQNRSFNATDNVVNATVFEKSVDHLQKIEKRKEEYKAFLEEMIDPTEFIVKTTEKAIQIKAEATCVHTHQSVNKSIWLPKSWLKDNKVSVKTLKQKVEEMREELHPALRKSAEIFVCGKIL